MERRAIVVHGIVQGVGFRPHVYRLARRLGLRGFVKNQTGTVLIEVEGEKPCLEKFLSELGAQPPPLAQIEHISWEQRALRAAERDFFIQSSEHDAAGPVFISPDIATCADCLKELFDPRDRRFGYPFLNCTNCGPRLTIITGAPYDRPRTTMAGFAMCAACRAEYDDPDDRRFHAQPTACAACGPRLQVLDAAGKVVATDGQECPSHADQSSAIRVFADALCDGKIGALKGLGGFHLACMAENATAVAALRKRKHRHEKPFAVMVPDIEAAARLAEIGTAERALLLSPQRPIVLLRKRVPAALAPEIAPRNPWLGVMLPYAPLHYLLMQAVGSKPLVMTSGNRSDEPIAYQDDVVQKLAGIADIFLVHDRPIHVRCDDSVTRVVDGVELPVRRSRGYAPRPIELPFACPVPILAVGGQLKATFALGRGRQAFISHHMGDLDHYDAYRAFVKDIDLYQQLFAVTPTHLVHDLHPDYASSRYAVERAAKEGSRLLTVQHHHAHLAGCLADNGLNEPVIGVTFDGTGLGTDGTIWGGEFLLGDYHGFRRGAHFRYVGMPGGDQAIREPWRMALAHLTDAQQELAPLQARILPENYRTIKTILQRRLNTPLTSSAGRLFDAIASLAGVRDRVSYEGQAAVELEWLATDTLPSSPYPFDIDEPEANKPLMVDTRPMIRAVAGEIRKGTTAAIIARRLHATMVEIVVAVSRRLRETSGVNAVVLSGGVFLNALLTSEVTARLTVAGFRVYRHRLVPPNDGGLCLGQLAVAAARLS